MGGALITYSRSSSRRGPPAVDVSGLAWHTVSMQVLVFPALLSAALAADDFEGLRFYVGDIHQHTGASGDGGSVDIGTCVRLSDGTAGECGPYLDLGVDNRASGLDFFATVDHVTSVVASPVAGNWETVFHFVNELDDPAGGLVTLPGAEIFVELPDGTDIGHRSLLFFGEVAMLSGLVQVDTQPSGSRENEVAECEVLASFMDNLVSRFGPALLLPHHPGVQKPMATNWTCFQEAYEPLVEVYSEHGSSLDARSSFDIPWSGYADEGTVRNAIDPAAYGLRMGFAGGSDNHDTHGGNACRTDTVTDNHPYGGGRTLIWQPQGEEFNRASVYAAFMAHQTYASTGPAIPLIVEVQRSDGAVVATMGESAELADDQDIVVEARVPLAWAQAVVDATAIGPVGAWRMVEVSDGIWRGAIPAAELPENVFVDLQVDGAVAFPDGCADGGIDNYDHIWSSPTFFDPAGPVDTGGDTAGPADTADTADTGDTAPVKDTADSALDEPEFGEPEDGEPPDDVPTHRFGCASRQGAAVGPAALLAGLALSRRRRP